MDNNKDKNNNNKNSNNNFNKNGEIINFNINKDNIIYKINIFQTIGMRDYQEDRYYFNVFDFLIFKNIQLVMIMDGHVNESQSDFIEKNFFKLFLIKVKELLDINNNMFPNNNKKLYTKSYYIEFTKYSQIYLFKYILYEQEKYIYNDWKKNGTNKFNSSGSTINAVFVNEYFMVNLNVGDSFFILKDNTGTLIHSNEHN